MTIEELRKDVITIVAELLGKKAEEVKPTDKLVETLACDELDETEIVMALEDKFDIEIPDDEAVNLVTVDDYVAIVNSKLEAKDTPPKKEELKKNDKGEEGK